MNNSPFFLYHQKNLIYVLYVFSFICRYFIVILHNNYCNSAYENFNLDIRFADLLLTSIVHIEKVIIHFFIAFFVVLLTYFSFNSTHTVEITFLVQFLKNEQENEIIFDFVCLQNCLAT